MRWAAPAAVSLTALDSPFSDCILFVYKFTHYIAGSLYVALFLLFLSVLFSMLLRSDRLASGAVCLIVTVC